VIDNARNIQDVRRAAKRRIPRVCFDYIDGGADDEVTMRANEGAYGDWVLRPRYLRDVSERDQSTTVLGHAVETPVLLSAAGLLRVAHRTGELGAARAAASHGTIFTLTSNSSVSIERVAEGTPPGLLWFQLYVARDRGRNVDMLQRAKASGYSALVVTIDVPLAGKKERDIKNGFKIPLKPTLPLALDFVRHPRWVKDYLREGPVSFANFSDLATGNNPADLFKQINQVLSHPAATFDDLAWLREQWDGPLVVKGIMTGEDTKRSIEVGADGVQVSNHGGRQLDGVAATLDVLPEIVEAASGRAEVLIDGGARRGIDVLRALALGAKAVLIGRPYVYGLAAAGEDGVSKVLEIYKREIDIALGLTGCTSVAELNRDSIARAGAAQAAIAAISR
jgi:isopentenyl diphosphate isomerase/L-lactate dehydrogenase-like FMN-dependent dehydrogenase